MAIEHTNPRISVVRSSKGAGRAAWESAPGWLKTLALVMGILAGAGITVSRFVPVSVKPVWETKDDADTAHAVLQGQINALREDLPKLMSGAVEHIPRLVADELETRERSARRKGRK